MVQPPTKSDFKAALMASVWFMLLTFPVMVLKVSIVDGLVWRWKNLVLVGGGGFLITLVWRWVLRWKNSREDATGKAALWKEKWGELIRKTKTTKTIIWSTLGILALLPFLVNFYQINIMTTALMYVVLGLGLNITVGLGGLLNLGYAAFFAIGAYTYALLNVHFGLGFWISLPVGACLSILCGLIIGIPVLRLRGDYLAIVTLGFGGIIRIILENWDTLSFGPRGIANIPKPGFFEIPLSVVQTSIYLYYIVVGLAVFTIISIRRLENSRLGRTWEAMREDEIACRTMGVNIAKSKVTAFGIGAVWAGFMGVVFAAKTTYVNPGSFTVWESIVILCIVVIGGRGSILGVILGSFVFILLPEHLRAFALYRFLIFGIALVVTAIFRPSGIIIKTRRSYQFHKRGE